MRKNDGLIILALAGAAVFLFKDQIAGTLGYSAQDAGGSSGGGSPSGYNIIINLPDGTQSNTENYTTSTPDKSGIETQIEWKPDPTIKTGISQAVFDAVYSGTLFADPSTGLGYSMKPEYAAQKGYTAVSYHGLIEGQTKLASGVYVNPETAAVIGSLTGTTGSGSISISTAGATSTSSSLPMSTKATPTPAASTPSSSSLPMSTKATPTPSAETISSAKTSGTLSTTISNSVFGTASQQNTLMSMYNVLTKNVSSETAIQSLAKRTQTTPQTVGSIVKR